MSKRRSLPEAVLHEFSVRSPDSKSFISAKKTASMTLDDTGAQVDMVALRAYRLVRLQAELKKHDYGAALLFDPINVRYATGVYS